MVAIQYGMRGPNMAVVSACATGGHAIGEAMEAIVRGQADLMLGAGTEAVIVPIALAGFSQMNAPWPRRSTRTAAPTTRPSPAGRSTRPATASSFPRAVRSSSSKRRSTPRRVARRPIAEVIGYGSTSDAFHMAAPAERGEGNQRAMRAALERAGIGPEEVDYINAHGTSTPLNDKYESMAIEAVFGEHARKLAISSTKSR